MTYRLTKLPLLRPLMRMKGATNETLAIAAGVAPRTVDRARRGHPVQVGTADLISQAIAERTFQRDNRGRKA